VSKEQNKRRIILFFLSNDSTFDDSQKDEYYLNWQLFGVLLHLFDILLNLGFQQWDIFMNNIPQHIEVYSEIIMNKYMSHLLNGCPWCLWVSLFKTWGQLINSLTYYCTLYIVA